MIESGTVSRTRMRVMLRDHVVQAFDMLDVQRGVDVDAGRQQLLDIQVALGMAAAGRVGVRQLVDQHQRGPALQDGVEVHLRQHPALVVTCASRDRLEPFAAGLGLDAAMGLDHADHDVHAVALAGLGREQHLVGLADAGRGAEEDLQPPAPVPLRRCAAGHRARAARQSAHLVALMLRHRLPSPAIDISLRYRHQLLASASSARLSFSTLTCGSPIRPNSRPSHVLGHQLAHARLRQACAPWRRAAPGTGPRPG